MSKIFRPMMAFIAILTLALPLMAQQTGHGSRYDQQIQQDVTKLLQNNEKFKSVHATVDDQIVTLEGQVPLYRDKADLRNKVNHVNNVQGVRNLVQVSSTVPDDQLQNKLAEKLRYDRIGYGIMFNNLNLKVNNGVVTIGGQVRDYPDQASALAIVEGTPGVKDVINDIKVLPVSNFDDELRLRLAQAIYGYPGLQKYALDPQAPIRIVVNNGHVQLDGVVDSQLDKQLAETRAREVPGVFSVKDNLIVAGENKQK